jgi:signal transduction histidine kinase
MLVSRDQRDGRGAAPVAVLIAAPILSFLMLLRYSEGDRDFVPTSALIAYALVLGAGVFVYYHWRMTLVRNGADLSARLAAWLTVGLVVSALCGLTGAVTVEPARAMEIDGWPLVMQLVVLAVLAGVTLVCERVDVPADPALLGALAGLVLTAGYTLTQTVAPPLLVSNQMFSMLNTLVMLAGLGLVLIVLQRTLVPLWLRRRIALAAVVLTAAQCATNLTAEHTVLAFLVVVGNLAGSIVLGTMTQSVLRSTLVGYHEELEDLHASLARVKADVQGDQELLHEVGSTLAGIASASRLIRQGRGLPAGRRQRLETMLAAELARLERLMGRRAPSFRREHSIDDVIEPLVVSHQSRGRDVRWEPSGLSAFGDPDDLAEVVNILLENAARHGAGPVWVQARADGDDVEIICSDSGSGVPPELRTEIFTTGVRGPDSEGHGFGLGIARRLMTDCGGSLELADSTAPGATFVALIPAIEVSRAAATHVA